ncbi:MAG: OmpH family outer membrane protein [Chthoniobacterales bacterium]
MNTMPRHLLLSALLFLGGVAIAEADVKIGTVDMNRVFSEYSKTKDAQAKYSDAEKAANDDLNNRVETLKKSMEEINRLNSEAQREGLSKEAQDAKKKEIEPKVAAARNLDREIAEFRTAKQKSLQDQFLRMRKDIVDDIMKTVNDMVKERGFDIVFDKSGLSAGAIPVVLYSRDDLDFSNDVLSVLNGKSAIKSLR